jgi:hypothetical protein
LLAKLAFDGEGDADRQRMRSAVKKPNMKHPNIHTHKFCMAVLLLLSIYSNTAVANCQTTTATITPSICAGQTFYIGAVPHTQSGTFADTLTNTGGCDSIVTIILTVNPIPTATFTTTSPLCAGQNTVITYTGTAGNTATYTWSFDGGNTVSGTGQGPYSVNWAAPGNKITTLVVSDSGCVSPADSVQVVVIAVPTATFTATSPICTGQNSTVTYTGTAGNTASFTWNFDGAEIISGNGSGPYQINFITTDANILSLDVSDSGCVSLPDTEAVFVNATPVSNAGIYTTYCSGDSAIIGCPATTGYTYQWTPAFGLSNAAVSNPTVGLTNTSDTAIMQTYTVTTSNMGCTSNDTVTITVQACLGIPQINANNTISIYPNPATDQLFIKTENIQPQTTTIYDVNGCIIKTMPFKPEIDVDNLSSGIYIIELTNNDEVARKRFVKM